MAYHDPAMSSARTALVCLLTIGPAALAATAAPPATGTRGLPAGARVRSELNLYLDLHHTLQHAAAATGDVLSGYEAEVAAYRAARGTLKGAQVWRLVNDACVTATGIDSIRAAGGKLPASLTGAERETAARLIDALASAWKKHDGSRDQQDHRIGLQNVMADALRRMFQFGAEEKVMGPLYEKMAFVPLDAPITIYPVIEMAEVGSWGKAAGGYYLVVPVARRQNLAIIETVVHELTHVIDANQPPPSRSLMARLRAGGGSADPAALEDFLHGLVTWNAGEMIRRYAFPGHVPLATQSPRMRERIQPWLATYESVWGGYLDGRLAPEQAIDGLLAALKPSTPRTGSPGS